MCWSSWGSVGHLITAVCLSRKRSSRCIIGAILLAARCRHAAHGVQRQRVLRLAEYVLSHIRG